MVKKCSQTDAPISVTVFFTEHCNHRTLSVLLYIFDIPYNENKALPQKIQWKCTFLAPNFRGVGYGPMSISILKLHSLSAICQSFVMLHRETHKNSVLEKKWQRKKSQQQDVHGCFAVWVATINNDGQWQMVHLWLGWYIQKGSLHKWYKLY